MIELADIFRQYGDSYIQTYGNYMLPSHIRAIEDICKCRTDALDEHLQQCDNCGYTHTFYNSCYNRNCPKCQYTQTQKWLEHKEEQFAHYRYFHVVFTVPEELRGIIRSNQKELYSILFNSAVYALQKLMIQKWGGGGGHALSAQLAVLHTWTRTIGYHPHLHVLVPAGVIQNITDEGDEAKKDNFQWAPIKGKFLVPLVPLAEIFRARFHKLAKKALPQLHFPCSIWDKEWVIYCKPPIENNHKLLEYLSRYLHRIAITNSRILKMEDGKVTFKYKKVNDNKWKMMTVTAFEFIRRYLQHVLPQGFHKIRYYGFFAPAVREKYRQLLNLLQTEQNIRKVEKRVGDEKPLPTFKPLCPMCKEGNMVSLEFRFSQEETAGGNRAPPLQ
jgi:hypothetical protein